MRRIHRIVVRHMIAARSLELTSGTTLHDADLVLGRCFPDYEPVKLPEPEPGAWMPQTRTPRIYQALRKRHAGGGNIGWRRG